MSKKYNEIMDKVVVTDELRERLLVKIRDVNPDDMSERYKMDDDTELADMFSGRRRKRPGTARILAYLAAACAIIIVMGAMATMIGVKSSDMVSTGTSENAVKEETADQEEAAVEAAAEEPTQLYDEAETDTVVGAAGTTADTETVSAEPVTLSEGEIREVIEAYIGEAYKITDMTEDENLLIYTISGTASGEASTYIRIDLISGRVEIEDVLTQEIKETDMRDLVK